MKKSFLILTALVSVLFFYSCSKEKSIESAGSNTPDNPGTNPDNTPDTRLLIKTVSNFGLDSVVTLFAYNEQKRLTGLNVTAQSPDFNKEDFQIIRSSGGDIQQYVYKSDEYRNLGLDSLVYDLFYNGTAATHKIVQFEDQFGSTRKDSIAYTYDAQNRIIKEERFNYNADDNTYFNAVKMDYSYNSSGLAEVETYFFNSDVNDYQLSSEHSYEYDDKQSPLVLGNEAIILEQYQLWSSHNPTKESVNYVNEPTENTAATATYTYDDKNKPSIATITEANRGISFTTTYYYR